MKLYVQTPDGQVFIRTSPNEYEYASVGRLRTTDNPRPWYVVSWHRRIDLASKAADQMRQRNPEHTFMFVKVSREPLHGPCARCDGTGKYRCTACRGRHEGDRDTQVMINELDANGKGIPHATFPFYTFERKMVHWVCAKCPADGLVKCNVCRGKGQL